MLSAKALILIYIWIRSSVGERYQYFLDIRDMLDPSWVYIKYNLDSKIQCATLCYRDKGNCAYFGYRDKVCYLLSDNVDRLTCSQDDCTVSGMKVYKWQPDGETTITVTTTPSASTTDITEEELTSTSTTSTTGITIESTLTDTTTEEVSESTTNGTSEFTTEPTTESISSTTTTESSTVSTTESPTSTTESTTDSNTDVTTELSTESTTDMTTESTTTTTESPTESTTDGTTESTTDGTTESTTESTALSTTESTTDSTTTTSTTTTTEETTAESGEIKCDPPPDATEIELSCPDSKQLLSGMYTRGSFFRDALTAVCSTFNEFMYGDEEEVFEFFSADGGISINVNCPGEDHVITKYTLCIKTNGRVPIVTIHCRFLKNSDKVVDRFNATSDEDDRIVDCGRNTAVQRMYFMESKTSTGTSVIFACLEFEADDVMPDAPSNPPGGGI